jgi:hypothetical protein
MKRLFFFAYSMTIVLISIIFFGCNKSVQTKSLVANAGTDSVINMPQAGSLWVFKAFLNGEGSHSTTGGNVSYSWIAINHDTSVLISSPNTDTTAVLFEYPRIGKHVYTFKLEVRDNLNHVDYDTVSITINRKFHYEYDGISWGPTINALTYINLNSQLSNDGNYPPDFNFDPDLTPDLISLCTFNGNCNDINSWKVIPYVSHDSIELTDKNLFYSSNSGWYVIYATPNAGIDFSQNLSVGVSRTD